MFLFIFRSHSSIQLFSLCVPSVFPSSFSPFTRKPKYVFVLIKPHIYIKNKEAVNLFHHTGSVSCIFFYNISKFNYSSQYLSHSVLLAGDLQIFTGINNNNQNTKLTVIKLNHFLKQALIVLLRCCEY